MIRTLIVASTLIVLTSCSSGDDDSPGADEVSSSAPATTSTSTAPSTSTDPTTPASESDAEVVSVSLVRSGGLKPITVSRTFSEDVSPPQGFSAADVTAVLRIANTFVSSDVMLKAVPRNSCCDRYSYEVTMTRADGTAERFQTIDGLRQPPVFEKLLSAMA